MAFKKPVLIFILFVFLHTLPLFGEDGVADEKSETVENSPLLPVDKDTPIPYSDDEFSEFFLGVRRFDVILFGSIPLTFMLTSLIYDFSIYAYNEFDSDYGFGTARTEDDLIAMGVITLSISAVIAIIDIIIYSVKRHNAASLELAPPPVP